MTNLNLIPQPRTLTAREGQLGIASDITIVRAADLTAPAALLQDYLQSAGYTVSTQTSAAPGSPTGDISLTVDGPAVLDEEGFADESYTLTIAEHGMVLHAPNKYGLLMGIQTLRQIFMDKPADLPCCRIDDAPAFRWRGAHLDVSRHFFSKEDVLRFMDVLALHRCNRLHLHLTDDQGWRIEIKKYPKLTEIASRRPETLIGHHQDKPHTFDGREYGGFYTQAELKEMVAFAHARGMEILPEIDMPGHMQAAIAAYPELGCTGFPIQPRTIWGISQDILNPEETTVKFMQDVLDEVMDIFPSRFIHVGGDEAHKYQWENSKRVQERMAETGATDEKTLQSWFIAQMATHIAARGRRTIGWDEIMEGGCPAGAAVMSWRGEDPGREAVKQGITVVMTPSTHTYFDHHQKEKETKLGIGGFLPLSRVYAYSPIPDNLEGDKSLILGSQGQHWTEYITTRDHLDYMAYPRQCALAEVMWSPKELHNYEDFCQRLTVHKKRLQSLDVAYCR